QFAILGVIAGKYRALFTRLGEPLATTVLVRAHLRRHVVSTLIPLGGPAGLARFVRDLGTHNVGANTVVYASVLASMVNEIAFGLVLVPVLAWLALAGRATAPMVGAAAVMGAVRPGGLG